MSDDKMRKMKQNSFMKSTQSSRASSVDTTPPNVTPNVVLAASKQRRALDREAAISDIITVNVDLNFQSEVNCLITISISKYVGQQLHIWYVQ